MVNIKGQICDDGITQRSQEDRSYYTPPIVFQESVIITAEIEAHNK